MVKYLMHGIYDRRNRLYTRVPLYNEELRDKILQQLQETGKFPPYFTQKIREPLTNFPRRLLNITYTTRRIAGEHIDKSGESRRWTKIFKDFYITSVVTVPGVDATSLTEHKITTHRHGGEIRVITNESITFDAFVTQAKIDWPEDWQEITSKLKG